MKADVTSPIRKSHGPPVEYQCTINAQPMEGRSTARALCLVEKTAWAHLGPDFSPSFSMSNWFTELCLFYWERTFIGEPVPCNNSFYDTGWSEIISNLMLSGPSLRQVSICWLLTFLLCRFFTAIKNQRKFLFLQSLIQWADSNESKEINSWC